MLIGNDHTIDQHELSTTTNTCGHDICASIREATTTQASGKEALSREGVNKVHHANCSLAPRRKETPMPLPPPTHYEIKAGPATSSQATKEGPNLEERSGLRQLDRGRPTRIQGRNSPELRTI